MDRELRGYWYRFIIINFYLYVDLVWELDQYIVKSDKTMEKEIFLFEFLNLVVFKVRFVIWYELVGFFLI